MEYRRYRDEGKNALSASRYTEAIEAFGHAALFHPNDPEAQFNLGKAFQSAGKIEAARQAYIRALDVNPGFSEVRRVLLSLPPLPPGRSEFPINQLVHAPDLELAFWVLEVRKGGFGAVYVVEEWPGGLPPFDERGKFVDEERSALKTLQARFLWSDEDRDRFERECLHWIMLDRHPNIVHARAVVKIEGFPCLWLEYCAHNLGDVLRAGPLSLDTALRLSFQFCDGMLHAHHKMGLVHRDIKPSNCLLSNDNRTLKISDWGLSRVFRSTGDKTFGLLGLSRETESQLTCAAGTPQYMASEQFQPAARLDTRTDIYSFGIMLYEMLTRDLPPVGYMAYSHIACTAVAEQIPSRLRQIILRCVHPNPDERPRDFREVRSLLETTYSQKTTSAAPAEAKPLEMSVGDWNDKGLTLSRMGYPAEACECYEHALNISPSEPTVLVNYSGELCSLGRLDDALLRIDQGLNIDPENVGLWKNKSIVLEKLGRVEESDACFERLLDLQAKWPSGYYQWRDMTVGCYKRRKYELALKCCDAALGINKRDADVWKYKAIILHTMGRYEAALVSCEEGLAIEPREHELWNIRAVTLTALERFEEALLACNRGLEIDGGYILLWQNKATALRSLDRPVEAEKCSEMAEELEASRRLADSTETRVNGGEDR
ncbi:MAG TPA: protein kinase [Verrucomicrobiae bacterium]|nr:protein kinase [Verrucomicrobiae bacterium]